MRESLRRWHLWLGWIAGVPLLLWTLSGLVMVSRPIAEVRSENSLNPVPAIAAGPLTAPVVTRADIKSLALAQGPAGPRWRIGFADGSAAAADARTGAALPRISAAEAATAATARYKAKASIDTVVFVPRDHRPREFNRPVDSWQVSFADGMHIYVDAWSGETLVARSRFWRLYDVFWGLHIMDIQGRENPHNPWIVTFAVLALASVLLALGLLPGSTRRMLKSAAPQAD